jgi:hypothetical protein
VKELPELVFDLGGYRFVLSPYEYTLEMEFGNLGVRCVLLGCNRGLGGIGTRRFYHTWDAVFEGVLHGARF